METKVNRTTADLDILSKIDYLSFNKMLCNDPTHLNKLSFAVGTAKLKPFIEMKRNVIGWYDKQSDDNKTKIMKYIHSYLN